MRCYFMRAGHIVGVELLDGLSDAEACERAHVLFSERKDRVEGFEVWERDRVVDIPAIPAELTRVPLAFAAGAF
jgi:hypothetical protein